MGQMGTKNETITEKWIIGIGSLNSGLRYRCNNTVSHSFIFIQCIDQSCPESFMLYPVLNNLTLIYIVWYSEHHNLVFCQCLFECLHNDVPPPRILAWSTPLPYPTQPCSIACCTPQPYPTQPALLRAVSLYHTQHNPALLRVVPLYPIPTQPCSVACVARLNPIPTQPCSAMLYSVELLHTTA